MKNPELSAEWTSAGALGKERDAWIALANTSGEPNPFYTPGVLLASERHLHDDAPIPCIAIRDPTRNNQLCGLFPLNRPFARDGMLGLAWSLYRNAYTCITTPLIEAGLEKPALETALALIATSPGPKRLAFPQIIDDGPVASALAALAQEHDYPFHEIDSVPRAIIRSGLSPDAYRRKNWSKARRSKMRRKLEALHALGEVNFRLIHGSSPEGRTMIEEFLALEIRGWKGKAGTALASRPETHAFALAAHSGHEGVPEVIFEQLTLNGRTLAMNINLVGQTTAFTVKTAYDESFARQSPGLLLDGEAIGLACADGKIGTLDSCAAPGHPLEDIWNERQQVVYRIISARAGGKAIMLCHYARWIAFARKMIAKRHNKLYTTRPGIN